MRIVVSLGSSALLGSAERPEAVVQRGHMRAAALALAPLAREHELIICCANDAQLGALSLESENDETLQRPYPLDVVGAQTQGMIGGWIVQELYHAGVQRPLVALVTHTVVDPDDVGFRNPTTFIGPGYSREQVQLWAGALGWQLARDHDTWRRVVPNLNPVAVRELQAIRTLAAAGTVVVCGGGGGVAVCDEMWARDGLDAVVDADLTAALLAIELDADSLLLLTDVDGVKRNFGAADETSLTELNPDVAAELNLPAGSMGTKVEAARRFAAATGRGASIGALDDVAGVLSGFAGTTMRVADRAPNAAHR